MILVLLGAPGSGKGTQASLMAKSLNVPVISTGDILRAAIREQTETGLKAKAYVDAGRLVPDGIVAEALRERIGQADCAGGYILDGYPRTIPQAEMLEELGISPGLALSIEVPDSDIERRMTGRRVCLSCNAVFHTEYNPARQEGVCDVCGERLTRREDDEPGTVRERLRVYHEQSEPLKGFYERLGRLRIVVGTGDVSEINRRLMETIP
ncbi:MAG: adenylate kinase [Oscillospiraceae bacterium]|jgi:adenylate kinase|nr:adenylate kinase [Oscillospiraceae bacterium]